MPDKTNRDSDKFMLRMPDGMRDRIKVVADQNKRSMNAEIIALLEKKFPKPPPPNPDADAAMYRAYKLAERSIKNPKSFTKEDKIEYLKAIKESMASIDLDVDE